MLEWLQPVLGFVSASLVALIALGFGLMMLFFSGSAVIVLGQFLPFVRPVRTAVPVIAAAAVVAGIVALVGGAQIPWAPPISQTVCATVAWGFVRWERSHRWLRLGIGLGLLGVGIVYPAALALPALEPFANTAVFVLFSFLLLAALGLWPLVLGGLVRHYRERGFEWFISLRYLFAKRRQTFISVITVICVTGVALGVAVITVVLSVMNGFSEIWEGKILGTRAHFVVHSRAGAYADYFPLRDEILKIPGIEGAAPFLASDAILRGESGELMAVQLKGIDPGTVGEATSMPDDMVSGSLDALAADLTTEGDAALPGVIVGAELADRFFLRLGDPLLLISPLGGAPTPMGIAPRMMRFRVAGVFEAGFFLFDESLVYSNLAAAQKFMKLGDVVTGIEVRTSDAYRSQAIGRDVEAALGDFYYARDWKTFYPGFFQALKVERIMMFVLLSFIMVVAGFIIIAVLITMIMEKSRDIAILKTMGCDDEAVLRVFAIQGFLIGVVGLALGMAMGLLITQNLDVIQGAVERVSGFDVLPANVYQLSDLPYDVIPWQLGAIAVIALVLSIGATLLPSWQASKMDPAEALRYE
jgi:lipoprotein-releasing system permease protein